MKRYLNISIIYAILAMVGGVFYWEFTKFNDFEGVTVLSKIHTHLFVLGMIIFLFVELFRRQSDFTTKKMFQIFMIVYNAGVALTVIMMLVRGILQVLGTSLSTSADAAISGISGLGHIATGVGLILFLLCIRSASIEQRKSN